MSYTATQETVSKLQQHIQAELVSHLRDGRRFRLVGDNVDFKVDVSHQRLSTTKEDKPTTEHWFASAAIVQEVDFNHLSDVKPREDLISLPTSSFIPQADDWAGLKEEFVTLIMQTLVEHLPAFQAFNKCWLDAAKASSVPNLGKKQAVVPLAVLPKSEQKYSEVVDVLDYYESFLEEVHAQANLPLESSTKVQIGGDQLTRERFSGAKRLRCTAESPSKRFDHLHPITFEPFHLQMKILTVLYKILYNEKSLETGTLGAEKIRLCRTKADGKDVTSHFNDCSELAISLVNAYIVEAACEFFGIQDSSDKILPAHYFDKPLKSLSNEEKMNWMQTNVGDLVDSLVWPHTRKHMDATEVTSEETEVVVNMPDGSRKTVTIIQPPPQPQSSQAQQDDAFTYGQNVLEIGLIYKAFAASVKVPKRNSMLRLMKYVMLILKGDNNRSKYSLEILRLLFHQLATLSEKTAHESFYGMFVNTQGKPDSHIAADMKMEHVVQHVKGHIRYLKANKSEKTIQKKTGAFAALDAIAHNFDEQTHVLKRYGQAHTPSSHGDEVLLIQNLRRLRPFQFQAGRKLLSVPRLAKSPVCKLSMHLLKSWIRQNQLAYSHEIGQ
ncbi:hypothetical protein V1264_023792 [Littorina saxatilis]|uniref:DUF6589 domain-containing protein n=1 Tax=Littorina saxatilis TaxID=31220 RepID=A0AAN9BCE7_9CAEN